MQNKNKTIYRKNPNLNHHFEYQNTQKINKIS